VVAGALTDMGAPFRAVPYAQQECDELARLAVAAAERSRAPVARAARIRSRLHAVASHRSADLGRRDVAARLAVEARASLERNPVVCAHFSAPIAEVERWLARRRL
jgi:hypothetical protein